MKTSLHRDRVTPIPKPPKKRKKRPAALNKRAKRKIDDGRKDLENECMDLWRLIVSHGKTVCEWCKKPHTVYQCHHVVTKGSSGALKYDTENGVYLGKGCHFKAHNSGYMIFTYWFIKKFPGLFDKLHLRKNNKVDHSVNGLKLIKRGLEQELDKLIKKS